MFQACKSYRPSVLQLLHSSPEAQKQPQITFVTNLPMSQSDSTDIEIWIAPNFPVSGNITALQIFSNHLKMQKTIEPLAAGFGP